MTPKTQKVIERILTKLEDGELSYTFLWNGCIKTVIGGISVYFYNNEVSIGDYIKIIVSDGLIKDRMGSLINKEQELSSEKTLDFINKSLDSL